MRIRYCSENGLHISSYLQETEAYSMNWRKIFDSVLLFIIIYYNSYIDEYKSLSNSLHFLRMVTSLAKRRNILSW